MRVQDYEYNENSEGKVSQKRGEELIDAIELEIRKNSVPHFKILRIGKNDEEIGPRFPDMSMPYDKDLVNLSEEVAKSHNINIQKGVYVMMPGPTYETPAEVKMIRIIGGDAVGMSTVPEVIVAKHAGLKVLGISCITNMASGILDQSLNHQEVIETSTRVKDTFTRLITNIIEKM